MADDFFINFREIKKKMRNKTGLTTCCALLLPVLIVGCGESSEKKAEDNDNFYYYFDSAANSVPPADTATARPKTPQEKTRTPRTDTHSVLKTRFPDKKK